MASEINFLLQSCCVYTPVASLVVRCDPFCVVPIYTALEFSVHLSSNLSSGLQMPVSSTHATIGGIAGVAIAAFGLRGVVWNGIGMIVASWFISPVCAGALPFSCCWISDAARPPSFCQREMFQHGWAPETMTWHMPQALCLQLSTSQHTTPSFDIRTTPPSAADWLRFPSSPS
eukprot:1859688-Rhodomonas_salina.1